MPKALLFFLLFYSFALIPSTFAQQDSETITVGNAELLWDEWGVPHIFASDNNSLFYAFGWAQAYNDGDLILKLFGEARGRAAEYWGESFLDGDRKWRTVSLYQQAQTTYDALDTEWQDYLIAFTAGFNAYAGQPDSSISEQWKIVLPVTPVDVVAHGIRVLRYEFVARAGFTHAGKWESGELSPSADLTTSGSNAWAIAPSRSASGNAMLVANPHQPWFEFGLWIEAHLVTPDMNLYGAALLGAPVLGIGFNENLGWTHTVNTHDGWDLYHLTLGDDGKSYALDGEMLPFTTRDEIILLKNEDGSMSEVPLTIKESLHGPIIAQQDDEALALRVVGENSFAASQQWWEMGHAQTLAEFETVLRNIRIPMFTVMYADREGNILMVFNEQIPVRETGDWAFWNNTTALDDSQPAFIPGDDSQYIWPHVYHPYEDLPRLLNPDTGWLQNANEPPWTSTLPLALDPADYPAYFAPQPYVWPRPVMSMRMLYEDDSITYDELLAYKHSTRAELADDLLEDLIAAARATDSERLHQAADVLENWDRTTDADSVGAALFTLWVIDYVMPRGVTVNAVQWDINDPFNTPNGLSDPEGAVASLLSVANQLEGLRLLGIGMEVPYGDIFRLRWGDYDLPANGSYDHLGTFRILTFVPDTDLRLKPVHGDSYIAVVEFAETVRAKVLLSYGNSTQPGSPHVGDQLELFARKELRDAWLTRDDIEAHLEDSLAITEPCTDVPSEGKNCWSAPE